MVSRQVQPVSVSGNYNGMEEMAGSEGNDLPDGVFNPLSRRETEILGYIARGSSDREIARALFLSLNTIKWHNRQIYSKLGVPNRRQAVALARREGLLKFPQAAPESVQGNRKHNFPAEVTSFVGRQTEIAQIAALLTSARLLTLTGPGGVGKTRLSLKAAGAILDEGLFKGDAYFVDLAPLRDPELLATAIVEMLALPEAADRDPQDSMTRFIGDRQILLILDNLEHLLDGVSLLADLLKACPRLTILATSRESLSLSGEHRYPVPPLELDSAVDLFQQRVLAVKRDLKFDEKNLEAVQRISTRLDGLPLALELAAARLVLLSPQALLQQLESRLDTLKSNRRDAPARQQTLRATLDWSYELLNQGEKTLFNRLGVFVGGCSLEAADAVCAEDLDIGLFSGLEGLLNKSLLLKEDDREGEPYFTMLETVREYALDRLAASGERESILTRHAEYYASLAERAEPALKNLTDGIEMWGKRIEQAFDNLRAAFYWSIAGEVLYGLRIVNALDGLWWYTHYAQQGSRWIDLALERMDEAPLAFQAQTLITSGLVALTAGDWELSRERGLQAVSILRQLDDEANLAYVLGRLGITDLNLRRFDSAEVHLLESLQIYEQLDDDIGAAFVLNAFGESRRLQQRYKEARSYYERSIDRRRQSGGEEGSAALYNLASTERHLGNDESAFILYKQALAFSHRANQTFLACASLMGMAGIMAVNGNPLVAARLLGATEAILETNNHTIQPTDKADYDRSINDTRALLDKNTFETAWAEGRAMKLEEAIALAMHEGKVA